MASVGAGGVAFTIGGVLGKGLSILFRNLVPFGILALLITAPIHLLIFFTGSEMATGGLETMQVGMEGIGIVTFLLQFLLTFLLTAALTYGTFQSLRDRPVGLADCIMRGLGLVIPVLLVSIVIGLAFVALVALLMVAVFLFSAIPFINVIAILVAVAVGTYVYIGWWVVIPVVVVERNGVFNGISRSWDLVRGQRWRIFGIFVVIILLEIVLGAVLALLMAAMQGGLAVTLLTWVQTALVSAFFAVMATVGYHDLRASKEGIGIDEIAAVFD